MLIIKVSIVVAIYDGECATITVWYIVLQIFWMNI